MDTLKNKQRGVSFSGFIMIAFVLIFVAILGMKMVPAYVHSTQLSSIFKSIATDPAMQSATIKEIRDSYSKRAMMDSITDITAEDIDIAKDGTMLSLSANYSVKIPLVANITLLLEFNPRSDK
jgi:Tfp pilus assembly protein PilV